MPFSYAAVVYKLLSIKKYLSPELQKLHHSNAIFLIPSSVRNSNLNVSLDQKNINY